jgi:hypothetical protein
VFTQSVVNGKKKIIIGCAYCSDLGTIAKPDAISALICIEYIVKFLANVSFVHIKIKQWDNLFFLFQYKFIHTIIYKILFKIQGVAPENFARGRLKTPKITNFDHIKVVLLI